MELLQAISLPHYLSFLTHYNPCFQVIQIEINPTIFLHFNFILFPIKLCILFLVSLFDRSSFASCMLDHTLTLFSS